MVMESGFSSPRAIVSFPAGLRVLVVDDDPTWLKILEKMLKKCNYDVTTCGLAREALKLLRERKDGYDIVISDVNMPDMDGFKLLEHVGLEMDLPVIMMSVDGETTRVMKGVQHGACDYLLKPIRMKELKNIWQHVFRKRMLEVRDIESYDSVDDINLFRNAVDLADDGHFFSGGDQMFLKKRKDIDNKYGDKDSNDSSSAKKPRVVWSVDLHQKFVKAVNQIGFDKVGPKKILDLMNVPWLTRENVASHLQKYRLYLSRLQKENELKSACGSLKNLDQTSKNAMGGFSVHNSTSVSIRCPDYKLPVQSADTKKPNDIAPKCNNLSPLTERRKPFNSDIAGPHKAATTTTTSSPKIAFDHSLGSLKADISYTSFECPIASQYTWSGEVKDSAFEFEYKPQQQQEVLEMPFEYKSRNRLEDLVNVPQQLIQDELQQQATCFNRENLGFLDSKLLSDEIGNGIIEQSFLIRQSPEMFAVNALPDMNQRVVTQDGLLGLELEPSNHILGSDSVLGSGNDDLGFYLGDQFTTTTSNGFDNSGFPEYNFPGLVNEASPMCFYGAPRYEFEHQNDSMEYAVVDQGLSIS